MKAKVKTVLIAGAPTGSSANAGDEAILACMVRDLRAVFPRVEIIVASSNAPGTLERYGVRGVPFADIRSLIKTAQASDLMILGGGSIFYDYWGCDPETVLTKRHHGLAFYTSFALLATLVSKPLMIYAVGVGPLQSEAGKVLTRVALEQAQVITVRDADSKALLDTLGLDTSQVRITADPAFSFQAASNRRLRSIIHELTGQKKILRPCLGVALRNWEVGADPDAWESELATALDAFVDAHGGIVLFVPFHRTLESSLTDDRAVAERVSGRMRHRDKTLILSDQCSPEEKAGLLQNCDLVLGMRLHSVIFAVCGKVPTVALTYDPKVSSFLRAINAEQAGIDLGELTADKLLSLLLSAYEDRAEWRKRLKQNVKIQTKLSRENVRQVADLMTSDVQRQHIMPPFSIRFLKWMELKHSLSNIELEERVEALQAQVGAQSRAESVPGNAVSSSLAEFERQRLSREIDSVLDLPDQELVADNERPAPSRLRSLPAQRRVACFTNRLLDWHTREPRFGGGERYCVTLGSLLRDLGLEITFYQNASEPFVGDYYGFKVIGLAHGAGFSEFRYESCDAFYELSGEYDHVIYNLPNYASGRMRDDAILICHGIWFDYDSPSFFSFRTPEWLAHLYKAFSRPRKIVSVDANSINVIRALWPDLAGRMTYLPNWVDTSLFRPPNNRPGDQVTIIFPRRSDPLRGSRMLESVLNRLPRNCRVWWVGEGEDEDNELMRVLALRDSRLRLVGASFEEMPALYREADICVIPSVASEGTSLSCLEGLASGCAVVATTVGGLPELIHTGVNGLLVDPQPKAVARAINHLIENPGERKRMQETAVQTAMGFSLEAWRQRWTDLLGELGWLEGLTAAGAGASEFTTQTASDESDLAQSARRR